MASVKFPTTIYALVLAGLLLFGQTGVCAELVIDADRQLTYARSLLENSQYRRAAEEFQRFAFFFPDHPDQRSALLDAGRSFMQARDPQSAQVPLKALIKDNRLDPPAVEAHFLLAETYFQSGAPSHAVVRLNNLIALTDDPAIEDRAYHRIGWMHIEATEWDRALHALGRLSPSGRSRYDIPALEDALTRSGEIRRKSPALAGTLSIIPGGGQLYTGRYKDAAVALVLNVGTFWAAYEAFDNDQNALGSLLAVIGVGFYAGNIYGAINDAHKFNTQQSRRFVDHLRKNHALRSAGPSQAWQQGIFLAWRVSF